MIELHRAPLLHTWSDGLTVGADSHLLTGHGGSRGAGRRHQCLPWQSVARSGRDGVCQLGDVALLLLVSKRLLFPLLSFQSAHLLLLLLLLVL